MKARERILARVRRALSVRPEAALPSPPEGPALSKEQAIERFRARLVAAGARVERLSSLEEARGFLREAEKGLETAWVSPLVPAPLRPGLPEASPEEAALGVSRAAAGVAETGSVLLSSREGRRGQLLVPRHLVWVFEEDLYGTLLEALRAVRGADDSALALHSGPSKSADIGQIMVKGVHGPGELWVGVLAFAIENDLGSKFHDDMDTAAGYTGDRGAVVEALRRLVERQAKLTTPGHQAKEFWMTRLSKTGKTVFFKPRDGEEDGLPVLYIEEAVKLLRQGFKPESASALAKAVAREKGIATPPKASYLYPISLAVLKEIGE